MTHGLEGLDVDFFLHKDEVLECNSGIVVDHLHSLKKRVPWTVVPLRCFLLLPYYHALHSWSCRCLQCPAQHVEGVMQARKKKCGSWFDAESAPLGWGGLVKMKQEHKSWVSRPHCGTMASSRKIGRVLLPAVQISIPSHFTHRDFPFLFFEFFRSSKCAPQIRHNNDRPAMR